MRAASSEQMRERDALAIWTIYARPRDYPDHFVARKFLVGPNNQPLATQDMFVADSVEEVRALLPPGLVCLARSPSDDLRIVESWL